MLNGVGGSGHDPSMDEWTLAGRTFTFVMNILTAGYRLVYRSAIEPEGLPTQLVAPFTWLFGSLLTLSALASLAFAWHAFFMTLRWRAQTLMKRATLGANLKTTRRLVDQYVRFERAAGILQTLSRVFIQAMPEHPIDAFTERGRGSRAAALALSLSMLATRAVVAARYVLTTVWGLLSLASTWWALGLPGLVPAAKAMRDWQGVHTMQWSPLGISMAAVALAAMTFVLSRLRGPIAVGHQAWRRNEATQASTDLADREIAIQTAIDELEEVDWAVHSSWESSLLNLDLLGQRRVAESESELRQLLLLPQLEPTRLAHGRSWFSEHDSPRDQALVRASAAITKFEQHLDEATVRAETRLGRAVPWKVVRLVSRRRLKWALQKVDAYVTASRDVDVPLTPAIQYVRLALVTDRGETHFRSFPENFDLERVSPADRAKVVSLACDEWALQIRNAKRAHERYAHDRLIRGYIGLSELQAAADAIFRYIHPTGPLTKLMEWLRPV